MSWFVKTIFSSIGRKVLMSLTGLFLCTFLVVHMSGNFLLFSDDYGQGFNEYTYFMTHNPLIKTISYLLYASILIHAIDGYMLAVKNKKARPVGYAKWEASANSAWASRSMTLLGTVILIFLVIHLKTFWYEMHFGTMEEVTYNGKNYKDMYTVVNKAFSQWWYVTLYVISMIGLAYHLLHGFKSGFQTLGLQHKKYTPLIQAVGVIFAIVIPAIFASMPLVIFYNQYYS